MSRNNGGQDNGLVEYALILVLVVIVVAAVIVLLGPHLGYAARTIGNIFGIR